MFEVAKALFVLFCLFIGHETIREIQRGALRPEVRDSLSPCSCDRKFLFPLEGSFQYPLDSAVVKLLKSQR